MAPENINTIIAVCCILHNLCEIHSDGFSDAWLEEDMEHPQPVSSAYPTTASGEPQSIRQSFVEYLYQLYVLKIYIFCILYLLLSIIIHNYNFISLLYHLSIY